MVAPPIVDGSEAVVVADCTLPDAVVFDGRVKPAPVAEVDWSASCEKCPGYVSSNDTGSSALGVGVSPLYLDQ